MRMTRSLTDDIDDASVLLPPHDREHRLDHGKEAEHFVAQLPLENIERRAVDRAAKVSPGIIDQNVDAPESCRRRRYEIPDRGLVSDVGGNSDHAIMNCADTVYFAVCIIVLLGQFGDSRTQACRVARTNRDATALLEQRLRNCLADSARAAGDQGSFAPQAEIHSSSRILMMMRSRKYSMNGS